MVGAFCVTSDSRCVAQNGSYSGDPSRGRRDIPVIGWAEQAPADRLRRFISPPQRAVDDGEQTLVEVLALRLTVGLGMVTLGLEPRPELDGGLEVAIAFADRLEGAAVPAGRATPWLVALSLPRVDIIDPRGTPRP